VAGEGRFDTSVMRGLPQTAFAKGGAEGVHCASLPALGIGIAVKVDDGTKRGAEMALAILLAKLVPGAEHILAGKLAGEMRTWRGVKVGTVGPSPALKAAVRALPRQNAAAAAAPR
jgi:L-asparaginase II